MKRTASALLLTLALVGCATTVPVPEKQVLKGLVIANAETQRYAWQQRDAAILAKSLDVTSLPADFQQQLAATRSVDGLTVDVQNVEISGDTATVTSTQRLVRTVVIDGQEKKQTSTATQRHQFRKEGSGWVTAAPVEVTANWAGEAPKA